jgi:hypothetical protein
VSAKGNVTLGCDLLNCLPEDWIWTSGRSGASKKSPSLARDHDGTGDRRNFDDDGTQDQWTTQAQHAKEVIEGDQLPFHALVDDGEIKLLHQHIESGSRD